MKALQALIYMLADASPGDIRLYIVMAKQNANDYSLPAYERRIWLHLIPLLKEALK